MSDTKTLPQKTQAAPTATTPTKDKASGLTNAKDLPEYKEALAKGSSKPSPDETKAQKFVRLANFRTQKALKAIGQLQNLGNTSQYESTADQRAKIVSALSTAVKALETRLAGTKAESSTFTL